MQSATPKNTPRSPHQTPSQPLEVAALHVRASQHIAHSLHPQPHKWCRLLPAPECPHHPKIQVLFARQEAQHHHPSQLVRCKTFQARQASKHGRRQENNGQRFGSQVPHKTGQLLQPTDTNHPSKNGRCVHCCCSNAVDGAGKHSHGFGAVKQQPKVAAYSILKAKNGYQGRIQSHPKDSSTHTRTHPRHNCLGSCMGCSVAGHWCNPCSSNNSTRSCPVQGIAAAAATATVTNFQKHPCSMPVALTAKHCFHNFQTPHHPPFVNPIPGPTSPTCSTHLAVHAAQLFAIRSCGCHNQSTPAAHRSQRTNAGTAGNTTNKCSGNRGPTYLETLHTNTCTHDPASQTTAHHCHTSHTQMVAAHSRLP